MDAFALCPVNVRPLSVAHPSVVTDGNVTLRTAMLARNPVCCVISGRPSNVPNCIITSASIASRASSGSWSSRSMLARTTVKVLS
jgi:hypothetical protein